MWLWRAAVIVGSVHVSVLFPTSQTEQEQLLSLIVVLQYLAILLFSPCTSLSEQNWQLYYLSRSILSICL